MALHTVVQSSKSPAPHKVYLRMADIYRYLELMLICRFLLESLQSLHTALLQLDSGLLFQISPPEATAKQILSRLSNRSSVKLYYNVDYGCGAEEEAEDVEQALQQAAQQAGK